MALPLWLISQVPALGRRLPAPGPWLATFRQAMAFPLLLTALWLLWLLQRQDDGMVIITLGLLLLLVFLIWLLQRGFRKFALASLAVSAMLGVIHGLATTTARHPERNAPALPPAEA